MHTSPRPYDEEGPPPAKIRKEVPFERSQGRSHRNNGELTMVENASLLSDVIASGRGAGRTWVRAGIAGGALVGRGGLRETGAWQAGRLLSGTTEDCPDPLLWVCNSVLDLYLARI